MVDERLAHGIAELAGGVDGPVAGVQDLREVRHAGGEVGVEDDELLGVEVALDELLGHAVVWATGPVEHQLLLAAEVGDHGGAGDLGGDDLERRVLQGGEDGRGGVDGPLGVGGREGDELDTGAQVGVVDVEGQCAGAIDQGGDQRRVALDRRGDEHALLGVALVQVPLERGVVDVGADLGQLGGQGLQAGAERGLDLFAGGGDERFEVVVGRRRCCRGPLRSSPRRAPACSPCPTR